VSRRCLSGLPCFQQQYRAKHFAEYLQGSSLVLHVCAIIRPFLLHTPACFKSAPLGQLLSAVWDTDLLITGCRFNPEEEEEEGLGCRQSSPNTCPAYCAIRNKFTNIFWGPAPTLSSVFTLHDPKVIARFLRECFEHRNTLVATQTGHSL